MRADSSTQHNLSEPAGRPALRRISRSLYFRISTIVVLVLLLAVLAEYILIGRLWENYQLHSLQQTHWNLAERLSVKLKPHTAQGIDYPAVEKVLTDAAELLAEHGFYLLDETGEVITYLGEPNKLRPAAARVPLEPVQRFIFGSYADNGIVFGPVPVVSSGERHSVPISAAPLVIDGRPGYVYVALDTHRGRLFGALQTLDAPRVVIVTTAAVILTASLLSLGAFSFLMRRFRRIRMAVESFEAGKFEERINDRRDDELGDVAKAIDSMQERISVSIRELNEKDSARRELIANVSHDLRGPVSSLRISLETLGGKFEQLSEQQRTLFVSGLSENVDSLSRLIHSLFELAKLEAKESKPQFEVVPLDQIAAATIRRCLPEAEQKQVKLSLVRKAGVFSVRADGTMLERILTNLIRNAIAYSNAGGAVEVQLAECENTVSLKVIDSGVGIPPEQLPHIRDRFYRAAGSGKDNRDGAGLGLAIVQRLLELHGSTLETESEVGRGSTFGFSLPLARTSENRTQRGAAE